MVPVHEEISLNVKQLIRLMAYLFELILLLIYMNMICALYIIYNFVLDSITVLDSSTDGVSEKC